MKKSNKLINYKERTNIYFDRGKKYHSIACGLEIEIEDFENDILIKQKELEKKIRGIFGIFKKQLNC